MTTVSGRWMISRSAAPGELAAMIDSPSSGLDTGTLTRFFLCSDRSVFR